MSDEAHYSFEKSDFGGRAAGRADVAFLRKKFPTRFRVRAWRDREGGHDDRGLEQLFDTDAQGFRAAKAYATELVRSLTALSAQVDVLVDFPAFFHIRGRDYSGEHVAISHAFSVEAEYPATPIEHAGVALQNARRSGVGVWEAEKRLRELTGRAW